MESHAELYAQRLALIEKIVGLLPPEFATEVGRALRNGGGVGIGSNNLEATQLLRELDALQERMVAEGAIDFIQKNPRRPI